ncbi:lipoprotein insertase outer membrane protein LolB [Vibrio sp. SS-MA-C1-2]|uniref:lipoprotein insertase outer membrane protein LolB n=1 Tax=Vibrio sp. SS-MA-C1-2 TaxID=2908646 RepID=UPI001F48B9C8|nr:lipoprotein insertase outer membrane protein LolB [Vibrio sp. SS-MA-C1-2]UJF18804.1 lipoprotein insertase outer membrane protein LolB [Vibrio sp. SS-MA-C1-2]
MRSKLHILIIALLSLITVSCATVPTPSVKVENWQHHQQKLSQLTHFTASGKIGYISPEERVSLQFEWQQQDQDTYQLRLSTFLGGTVLKLNVTPHKVTLVDREGKTHIGQSASLMAYQLTGLILPIDEMKDWIKGLPTGTNQYSFNEQQLIKQLNKEINSRQWQLTYNHYQTIHLANTDLDPTDFKTGTIQLPQNMVLSQNKQKIKFVINKWNLNDK